MHSWRAGAEVLEIVASGEQAAAGEAQQHLLAATGFSGK